jgi:hypothetical protein
MTAPQPDQHAEEDLLDEQERQRRQREINQPAIDLLDSWATGTDDERAEQRATWALLKQAPEENRMSDRKLFS